MSTPPLPNGLDDTRVARVANQLHSTAIHLLRRARVVDRKSDLSAERLSLLSVLSFAGPRTVGELAATEMVSRPAISRILNSLEDLGLIRRVRTTSDRRQVIVHATAQGKRVMERARRLRLERIGSDLAHISDQDLALLEAALAVLNQLEVEIEGQE
jgi:DNA-binding MarR family transcriptional regulator